MSIKPRLRSQGQETTVFAGKGLFPYCGCMSALGRRGDLHCIVVVVINHVEYRL